MPHRASIISSAVAPEQRRAARGLHVNYQDTSQKRSPEKHERIGFSRRYKLAMLVACTHPGMNLHSGGSYVSLTIVVRHRRAARLPCPHIGLHAVMAAMSFFPCTRLSALSTCPVLELAACARCALAYILYASFGL